ncbi:cellulose biosynthesis protein BcsQ [Pseudomonas sp. Marseille-QA0892]
MDDSSDTFRLLQKRYTQKPGPTESAPVSRQWRLHAINTDVTHLPQPEANRTSQAVDQATASATGFDQLREHLARVNPTRAVEPPTGLEHVHIVAVVSPQGGTGRTTVTANLSAALQKAGLSVVALDLDPQNSLQHHFRERYHAAAEPPGISRPETNWRSCAQSTECGAMLLPFGAVDDAQRDALEARLRNDPSWLRDNLDALHFTRDTVIVMDVPAGSSVYLRQALSIATLAVVVSLADAGSYIALSPFELTIAHYTDDRPDFLGIGHVLNQLDVARTLNRDIAKILHESVGHALLAAVPYDPSIAESLAYHRNAYLHSPDSAGCEAISGCAERLVERLLTSTLRAHVS